MGYGITTTGGSWDFSNHEGDRCAMRERLRYQIASMPHREELVAELWSDHLMLGEISQDCGEVRLELYDQPDGTSWRLPLKAVAGLIGSARRDLLNLPITA